MTRDANQLSDLHDVSPIFVILPDGSHTTSCKRDRATLSDGVYLHDVLFVPSLTCNLVSIHQMIIDLNCQIVFTNWLCII